MGICKNLCSIMKDFITRRVVILSIFHFCLVVAGWMLVLIMGASRFYAFPSVENASAVEVAGYIVLALLLAPVYIPWLICSLIGLQFAVPVFLLANSVLYGWGADYAWRSHVARRRRPNE